MKISYKSSDENYQELLKYEEHPDFGVNFSILKLDKNKIKAINTENKEYIIILFSGEIEIANENKKYCIKRENAFLSTCNIFQASSSSAFTIKSIKNSQILIVSCINDKIFDAFIFEPKDELVDIDLLEGKVARHKRPFLNRETFADTNMFCGELVSKQGSWICYPPHKHKEAEVYFYSFDKENGYAFVEDGDLAHRVSSNDLIAIVDENNHSQAVAPGYSAYILWMQRLQDNGEDIVYTLDPRYAHLVE